MSKKMKAKKCSDRSNDLIIEELQRLTRDAVDFLTAKKQEILKEKKQVA